MTPSVLVRPEERRVGIPSLLSIDACCGNGRGPCLSPFAVVVSCARLGPSNYRKSFLSRRWSYPSHHRRSFLSRRWSCPSHHRRSVIPRNNAKQRFSPLRHSRHTFIGRSLEIRPLVHTQQWCYLGEGCRKRERIRPTATSFMFRPDPVKIKTFFPKLRCFSLPETATDDVAILPFDSCELRPFHPQQRSGERSAFADQWEKHVRIIHFLTMRTERQVKHRVFVEIIFLLLFC